MKQEPLEVLRDEFPELARWIKSICRYGKTEDMIIADYKDNRLSITFYTKEYQYHISAKLSKPNLDNSENNNYGYLGCTVTTRKPRAGEDWNRGNDLPDGKYSEETWNKIINGIIAYELVKVVKKQKPIIDTIN